MREFVTYEWFTISFVLSIVLITLVKSLYNARFKDFLLVIGNSKYLKIYAKDLKFIDPFDAILFTNLVLGLGIFGHIAASTMYEPVEFNLMVFLKLCLSICIILLAKTLVERLIGSLFEIESLLETYLFQKTTYKNFTGLILQVSNLILLYAITPSSIAIFSIIGLVLIINLIGFITSFKNHQNLLSANFFYFLLYLCALEFGPYVILYKVITEFNA